MNINDLLEIGARMIQDNDDPATSGLDLDNISGALGSLLGGTEGTGLDLGNLLGRVADGDLSDIVRSWIGQGENLSLSPEKVTELIDADRLLDFAGQLGISETSARQALADALPAVVDRATPAEGGMFDDLVSRIGGLDGAMNMLGKLFR